MAACVQLCWHFTDFVLFALFFLSEFYIVMKLFVCGLLWITQLVVTYDSFLQFFV